MKSHFKRGDIVLVRFPFTDLSSTKVRPALVISSFKEDYIIIGIFSRQPSYKNLTATWVLISRNSKDFASTGLKKTSILKAEKITIVHRSVIHKKLGRFSQNLMNNVEKALKRALQLEG